MSKVVLIQDIVSKEYKVLHLSEDNNDINAPMLKNAKLYLFELTKFGLTLKPESGTITYMKGVSFRHKVIKELGDFSRFKLLDIERYWLELDGLTQAIKKNIKEKM